MGTARSLEILRCNGVDQNATPHPGMVVPVMYGRGAEIANGTMNRPSGVGFIADSRLPSTFVHEAGHFTGDMPHAGTDVRLLMRGDGSGYQIPFALAKRFRDAFAKRKVV